MKVYVHTLGCKVNQYESQAMETLLARKGHEIASEPDGCDAVIINTCAVTAESVRKSRQSVRHLRSLCPDAVIAVCGCASQAAPEDAERSGADLISGSADRVKFIDDLEAVYEDRIKRISIDVPMKRRTVEDLPAGNLYGRTRAMLKIQDGCSNFCTYCIIPYTRGPSRSISPECAVREASRLYGEGYREFIITGIEIASYGRDLKPRVSLSALIRDIAAAAPGVRLRLGSLEPRVITDEFCRELCEIPDVCPHFHLSLQTGCDATLSRMHRHYDTARFFESVTLLRKYFPGCAIAADLITGFPGETDGDFETAVSFVRKCDFSMMHVFPYSERPGTPAASMENSVPKSIRKERAQKIIAIAEEQTAAYLNAQIGMSHSVLFETEKGGRSFGHSMNYCEVSVKETGLHNEVRTVIIDGVENGILSGHIIL